MKICASVIVVCFVGTCLNVVQAADPSPSKVLEEARQLAAEGKYAEALEKHLWYHENALRIEPAQVGVRLSFALNDWIKLGEKYPKASEALVAIRDRNADRLSKGEGDVRLFQDTASINQYLGEPKRTVDVFKSKKAKNPALARQAYALAEEALVAAGEYKICSEYLTNPMQRLAELTNFRLALIGAKNGDPDADRIYADGVSRLIVVLARSGRTEEAENLRKNALATVDDPKIRDAGK